MSTNTIVPTQTRAPVHAHEHARSPRSRRRRRRIDPPTVAWPVGLLVLLVALGVWKAGPDAVEDAPEPLLLAARAFGDLRLDVPRDWRTLDRATDHVTWGSADREHTVTLSRTEAGAAPLAAVVREVVEQATPSLPGVRLVGAPLQIDPPGGLPRGDAMVVARFEAVEGGRRLHVVQVWRRDSRAAVDVVATWTSGDGRWIVDPRTAVPRAGGSR